MNAAQQDGQAAPAGAAAAPVTRLRLYRNPLRQAGLRQHLARRRLPGRLRLRRGLAAVRHRAHRDA